MVIAGSVIMILGAAAISFAEAPLSEHASWKNAVDRECSRYELKPERISAMVQGDDSFSRESTKRNWWEWLVAAAALGMFVWLAFAAERQAIDFNIPWMIILSAATLRFLVVCGGMLWKRTRFS